MIVSMERFVAACRITLGVMALVWGVNVFLQIIPIPKLDEEAKVFWQALQYAGYILPLAASACVIGGICCIGNKHVPLSILVLLPITVNMVLFHLFLDVSTGGGAFIMGLLNAYLLYAYRGEYEHLLEA